MSQFLFYCRQGFEQEAYLELDARFSGNDVAVLWKSKAPRTGFISAEIPDDHEEFLFGLLPELIFIRQIIQVCGTLDALPQSNKAQFIAEHIARLSLVPPLSVYWGHEAPEKDEEPFAGLWVEHTGYNEEESPELSQFCKKFYNPMAKILRQKNIIGPSQFQGPASLHERPQLVLVFESYSICHVCLAVGDLSSPYAGGVHRLRALDDCPSRSGLKLQEALVSLLDASENARLLKPLGTAADLGASPGGWTQVLLHAGFDVWAVDNGPMQSRLLKDQKLRHIRADGFTWVPPRPERPLDWVTCDIVDKPARVVDLMIIWLQEKYAKHGIFNLKLPMKSKYQEVEKCLERLRQALSATHSVRCKHLYHDRDEVTVACIQ